MSERDYLGLLRLRLAVGLCVCVCVRIGLCGLSTHTRTSENKS